MYADDTRITYASTDLHSMQSSLNRDLSNIHKWLFCNKLTLNSTKTEFMLIASRQKLSTLSESLDLSIDDTLNYSTIVILPYEVKRTSKLRGRNTP